MDDPSRQSDNHLVRVQQNVLARAERRLLNHLCALMPAWVTPNLLTAAGVIGAVAVLAGYTASNLDHDWLWLAVAGYLLNWFGDSMDGSIARYRRIERPRFGYFLDHSCDGIATFFVLAGVGLSPFVRLDVALVALTGYLLLSIHAFLSARAVGELKLSHLAAGPTEARLILIALTLAMWTFGLERSHAGAWSGYDVFVGLAGGVMIVLFVIQTAVTARRISAHDR